MLALLSKSFGSRPGRPANGSSLLQDNAMDTFWPARTHQGSFHLTPDERFLVVFGRVVSPHTRQEERSSPRVAQTVPNVKRGDSVLLAFLPTRAQGSRTADRRQLDGVR
jgi:hypothetical protein